MKVTIPDTPDSQTIRVELAELQQRAAELRALLRFVESRELSVKVYGRSDEKNRRRAKR